MYSKKLITEVKECYPDYPEIHRLADEGSVWLGRYLDDSSGGSVPIDTILCALTLEEIQVAARKLKRKINVYKMWRDEDPRK